MKVGADVAWTVETVEQEQVCFLARVPDSPPLELSASATQLWLRWVAEDMDAEEGILATAAAYALPPETVRPGALALLADLTKGGYLRSGAGPEPE